MRAALLRSLLKLRIARDVHGQELIEYALLLGLLATTGVAFLPEVGDSIQEVFTEARRALNRAAGNYHEHHH